MQTILRTSGLVLVILGVSFAEDVTFKKCTLTATGDSKPTSVDLVISDLGMTIRSTNKASVIAELPYGNINRISYSFMDRRRTSLVPVFGVSALFMKSQSHWLVIESSVGAVTRPHVLRLDKAEYRDVIAALNSKSGKRVELDPGSTLADPTIGSHDQDETVPFQIDQVLAVLKPTMEQYSCKAGKPRTNRIECRRPLRPRDAIGGSEAVTAVLEPKGQETRVQIKTRKGFGRNWSSPIYREMLNRLRVAR